MKKDEDPRGFCLICKENDKSLWLLKSKSNKAQGVCGECGWRFVSQAWADDKVKKFQKKTKRAKK